MINGATKLVELLDASDLYDIKKIASLDVSTYGSGEPTSIRVKNNLVAISIPADTASERGWVAFFDKTTSNFIDTVQVGYLPDNLAFTHDGMKILTANEGEPNSDYTHDPEGSISIIDLSNGALNATAIDADFKFWIGKENHLRNKGIRIFGNNNQSNAAQDIEPEYITITADNNTAYVSCQENNALAVVDINTATIVDLLPLGLKDHEKGRPSLSTISLTEAAGNNWPTLGAKHHDGGTVKLGGFSGLWYAEDESTGNNLVFYTIPDRGPNDGNQGKLPKVNGNGNAIQNVRPFLLPDYQARIVKFSIDTSYGSVVLDNPIFLTSYDGTTPISGKGNIEGIDEVPVAYYKEGTPYSNKDYYKVDGPNDTTFFHELAYDNHGGDFEGIFKDKDGNFWMCDEYRPAIYKFDGSGKMIKRFIAGKENNDYSIYGDTTLPHVYNKRWANRGFEGLCYDKENNIVYAFIQSPMYNPSSSVKDKSDIIRILGIDATTGEPVHEYIYLLTANINKSSLLNRVDKIGDATFIGNGKMWVIERDSDLNSKFGQKYVYEIDLLGATDMLDSAISLSMTSPTLEELSADELAGLNIKPVFKRKLLNLPTIGYHPSDKAEGIARLSNGGMAVMNDNDFGLEGAGITDNSVLGIISFDNNNSFDASDKADNIEMENWKTLGMYMPDAISSYNVEGVNYIVTANEGDSRDYDGYSEETRVADLDWNTDNYGAEVTDKTLLGRLKTTEANGDLDGDGEYDYIHSYGARSFSIYDEKGNQVYDSNNEFELVLADKYESFFNAQYDDEEFEWKSAKNRSDDKGAEPEGMATGTYNGVHYAFIGLERMSGIMVYDITNPFDAKFIQFISTAKYGEGEGEENLKAGLAGDLAPEELVFVTAEDSPTDFPLLLVANEVSGTVSAFGLSKDPILGTNEKVSINKTDAFYAFPTITSTSVNFSQSISGTVYSIEGIEVMKFIDTNNLSVNTLKTGYYVVKTIDGLTSVFNVVE